MDLLNQEYNQKQPNNKKIILILLIAFVAIAAIIIILMLVLPKGNSASQNNAVNNTSNNIANQTETPNNELVEGNLIETVKANYDTAEYDEFSETFIVSREGNYAVIDKYENEILGFEYQEIKILSYLPMLYTVKKDELYGIANKDGKILGSIEYNQIGYIGQEANNSENTDVISNTLVCEDTIVIVSKDGKYGILNTVTGEIIGEINLDAVYKLKSEEENTYIVELKNTKFYLKDYINTMQAQ